MHNPIAAVCSTETVWASAFTSRITRFSAELSATEAIVNVVAEIEVATALRTQFANVSIAYFDLLSIHIFAYTQLNAGLILFHIENVSLI